MLNEVNYISTSQTPSISNDLQNMNISKASDEELMDACKSFEAYFLEQVYKEMKKTVDKSEEESQMEEYFGEMLTEQYATNTVENQGVGIAKMLYESMKNNQGN